VSLNVSPATRAPAPEVPGPQLPETQGSALRGSTASTCSPCGLPRPVPGVGRRVRDVIPEDALGEPGPVLLPVDLTVDGAIAAATAAGALGRTPLAVVRSRCGAAAPQAAEDVVGSTTLAGLRALVRAEPARSADRLSHVAEPALPHVDAGEDVARAFALLGDRPAAWVLVRGNVRGWVRHARLAAALEPPPVPGPVAGGAP